MTEAVDHIAIDGTLYTEKELAELLKLDSLDSLDEAELQALLDEANKDLSRQLSEFITATAIASALLLLNNRRPGIYYFTPQQQYFRGRSPIPESRIQQLINTHRRNTSQRTTRHTRDLLANRISLRDYHQRMARDIVNGHIRMMELGAGGRRQLTRGHWERLREQLYGDGPGRGDLNRLRRHVERIQDGGLTEAQIRDRSRRYGANTAPSYEDGRHIALVASGGWEARRFLGNVPKHCPDCPGLQVLEWSPIDQVTPIGNDCRCHSNCACVLEVRHTNTLDGFDVRNFRLT